MTNNAIEEIWSIIKNNSLQFEQSIAKLHRKQTGSYYTSLDLTYSMMKELVNSFSEDEKNKMFKKTFLEPCVGTGNFVFAYLRVCYELNFQKNEYFELLNNIYACDINLKALEVYKTSLKIFAEKVFNIVLTDEYFDMHIGGCLLVNVDDKITKYIKLSDVFTERRLLNGFDIVVTNPPYKNLKAEKTHYSDENDLYRDKAKYVEINEIINRFFPYSKSGTANLYKLFVEEIVERYSKKGGKCSLLIPSSFLSDKSCKSLRTRLLTEHNIISITKISENSNYVDASQALCAILMEDGTKTTNIVINGSYDGNDKNSMVMTLESIMNENVNNSILVLSEDEARTRNQMLKHPTIKDIKYITNMRGELDISLNKTSIVTEKTNYRFIRGRNVGFYNLTNLNNIEYTADEFVKTSTKRRFIAGERLACQQIANMSKDKRLIFAYVPANHVLGNSCNFISIDKNTDDVDIYFLLGILNSSLVEWFFKLTSSNNHVSNYEIDNFPIPIHCDNSKLISTLVKEYIDSNDPNIYKKIDEQTKIAYGTVSGGQNEEN